MVHGVSDEDGFSEKEIEKMEDVAAPSPLEHGAPTSRRADPVRSLMTNQPIDAKDEDLSQRPGSQSENPVAAGSAAPLGF